jgi:hypothetical protein
LVKTAIRNCYVNSTSLMKWYVETDGITHEKILAWITRLIVELGNLYEDPYNTALGSKGSVAAHEAESSRFEAADGVTFMHPMVGPGQ